MAGLSLSHVYAYTGWVNAIEIIKGQLTAFMYRTVFLLLVLCHGLPGGQQLHPVPRGGGAGGAGGLDVDGAITHHAGAVSELWVGLSRP